MEKLSDEQSLNKTIAYIVYGLLGAGVFTPIPMIFAVLVSYFKKKEVVGTMLESHFEWQILTFWVACVLFLVGAFTTGIIIGYALLIAGYLWLAYRVYSGAKALYEGKKIELETAKNTEKSTS